MIENLNYWQKRLEQHFASPAQRRLKQELPVFALEHGLNQNELAQITSFLHARLRDPRLRYARSFSDDWLVWVVYAAEQGYHYDGQEYWTSFENRTPLWTRYGDRQQLRSWFLRFHQKYAGLKPTGAWAEWFSIISWPITHAILPKDLQTELARSLYELRDRLSTQIHKTPATVGEYVAKFSSEGSSRFRNFLEQEKIVGRITLALLGGRSDEVQHSIYPPTLERIVADLQQVPQASGWLREAVETVRIKGASPHPPTVPPAPGVATGKKATVAIRPRLMLRRTAEDEWTAHLELPSLRDVADLSPEFRQTLRQSRCFVTGARSPLPVGALLTGRQRRVLSSWPATGQRLIKFDPANPILEDWLQKEFRLTPGPRWLFRVGSDGLAREIIGRQVRSRTSYILVSKTTPSGLSFSNRTSIKCEGVVAQHLLLPDRLDAQQMDDLHSAGLAIAQTIRIWPAGLGPRNWDGEGFSEWLEGDVPGFAIDHDHPVKALELRLNNEPWLQLPAGPVGEPIFITLRPLPTGKHNLQIRAVGIDDTAGHAHPSTVDGYVALWVRTPRRWISGTIGHTGLVVTADPTEPTLDQFWEGEVRLEVLGPTGREATVRIELLDRDGSTLTTETMAGFTLPITREIWERAHAAFLRKERDSGAFLAASAGSLVVESDELGAYRVPLHRVVAPIRWVWNHTDHATGLRLIDDYQGEEALQLRFFSFAYPASPIVLNVACATSGYKPPAPGGLCVASYSKNYSSKRHALVVSTSTKGHDVVDPVLSDLPQGDDAIKPLLDFAELWTTANLTGPLAAERRSHVVSVLKQHVFRILCGDDWAAAEAVYLESSYTHADLQRLGQHVGGPPDFANILAQDADEFRRLNFEGRVQRFTSLAQLYGQSRGNACKAALGFCQSVAYGILWNKATIDHYVSEMRLSVVVICGARLLSLAWSKNRNNYAGWEKSA